MEIAIPIADGPHHAQADTWAVHLRRRSAPQAFCSGADAVANADENGDGQAKELDASSKDPTSKDPTSNDASSNDASRDATSQDVEHWGPDRDGHQYRDGHQ